MKNYKEIYISVDIESNGPIPGLYSMSSIGAFAAGGRTDDGTVELFDHTDQNNVFYAELAPITDNYIAQAINVGVLDGFDNDVDDADGSLHFAWMKEHGENPQKVMNDFAMWVQTMKTRYNARPIFMAYPLSFDWTFVYWYFVNFEVDSPFGFSGAMDLKTAYAMKSNSGIGRSTKRYMPKSLFSKLPHTHRADDDAIEQGIMGVNILNLP